MGGFICVENFGGRTRCGIGKKNGVSSVPVFACRVFACRWWCENQRQNLRVFGFGSPTLCTNRKGWATRLCTNRKGWATRPPQEQRAGILFLITSPRAH